jgi:hypothetical protein
MDRLRSSVRYHAAAHGLVGISVVRVITCHGHGALVASVRHNSSLGRCSGHGRIVGIISRLIRDRVIRIGRGLVHLLARI